MIRILSALAAVTLALLSPFAAQARWLEARSPNFIVYSDGNEDGLRKSVALLEDYDAFLRALTGTTAPPSASPLRVYLVGSGGKLRQVSNAPSNALGVYLARVGGTMVVAVRGDRPGLGGEEVLRHEYAHHFMSRYYPAYYPAWYREGFAEYVMTAQFKPDQVEVGRYNPGRAITLLQGAWLPVDRILANDLSGMNTSQVAQFYAESWLMVHYLFAAPARQEALTRYLGELHRGTPEAAAFQASFGMDHAAFEADLKHYKDGRIAYGVLPRAAAPAPDISVKALPPSADALLLYHAALMVGIPQPTDEAATIAAIREGAKRYPDDAYARRVLARAEIASGDRAAGTAAIDRLLEGDPHDAELLYVRGLADFYTGRKADDATRTTLFAAARPWFARAAAADHGFYPAFYRLAQTAPQADIATDETLAQLQTAHELAPLVGDIAIDTAKALASKGRYDEAEAALLPIATNPHGGNTGKAQALLASIRTIARQRR